MVVVSYRVHNLTVRSSSCFQQRDHFDVDVVEKLFFMLLRELSNLIFNLSHLKVPAEVGVSDVPRRVNDVPKCLVFKSLNYVNIALFRGSPQLHAVGPPRLQYLFVQHQLIVYRQGRSSSHEPIHFLVF